MKMKKGNGGGYGNYGSNRQNYNNYNYNNYNGYPQQNLGSNGRKILKRKLDTKDYIILGVIFLLIIMLGVFGYLIYRENTRYNNYSYGGGGGGGGLSLRSGVPAVANDSSSGDVLAHISSINNGNMPEITLGADGVPVFIDGKYSDVKVYDFATAMLSLNEIKPLLYISNTAAEFTGVEIYEFGDGRIFKLQQQVGGIPVYDKQLLIEAGADGTVKALCCDYDPGITVVTAPSAPQPDENNEIVRGTGYTRIYSNKLCVYNYTGEPKLAWCVDVGTDHTEERRLFISASDGTLISGVDLRDYEDVSASDMYGASRTIGVESRGDGFILSDPERGIKVYDCAGMSEGEQAKSQDNSWSPELVSISANVRDIYDYYKLTLASPAFRKGRLSQIDVKANFRRNVNEAYSYSECAVDSEAHKALISIGDGSNQAKGMDIAAHEFTHAVMHSISELTPMNESGAISEAYCDIMGVLIRDIKSGTSIWKFGTERTEGVKRNLEAPNRTKQPAKIGARFMKDYCFESHDHTTAGCDNGGIHTNCSIVGRAAYLIAESGSFTKEEMACIFAASMNYLVPTSDFRTCRAAVIHAARRLGFGEDKMQAISKAFKNVGIEYNGMEGAPANAAAEEQSSSDGTMTGKVASARTKAPIASAQVKASSIDGRNNLKETATDAQGVFTQQLSEGMYKVDVSMPGYVTCTINNVQIFPDTATNISNTILLDAIAGDPRAVASGRITNAVSGEGVSGATVRFMKDWGNTSGNYVLGSNGSILELITDNNGTYYTNDLIYGYYTGEVSMPGYAKQYFNLIASTDGSIASEQNVVLSPEVSEDEMRITLQWGDVPRDEDAHIKGNVPDSFHVFYNNKKATFGGVDVATLDHDDTAGNGFETITLKIDSSGEYKYFVKRYSHDGELPESNAIVKVYSGNVMLAQYNVPTNQGVGTYWYVFKIENGRVVPVNTITDEEP